MTGATHSRSTGQGTRPVERLTTDDDLFVRMEHALGLGVVNQCLLHLRSGVDPVAFARFGERLCGGRASRLVVRRPPPCRDAWRYTPTAGSVEFLPESVPSAHATAWADRQATFALDSVSGPSWRLAAAQCADGPGTYVSFIATHATGDGRTQVTAIADALAGADYDTDIAAPCVFSDLSDGVRTAFRAARAALRAATAERSGRSPSDAASTPRPATVTQHSDERLPASAMVTMDHAEFVHAAQVRGGSVNSLFVAMMVGLLERSGMISPDDVVPVSLPMSSGQQDDRRANATTGATAHVRVDDERYSDLSPIRRACRDAYAAIESTTNAVTTLSTIAQALGDGTVRRLAAGMSTPLCLASNVGALTPAFASLGTDRPGEVVMRAMTSNPTGLRGHEGGISGWLCISGDIVSLAVSTLDPRLVGGSAGMRSLVGAECAAWELRESDWGTCG